MRQPEDTSILIVDDDEDLRKNLQLRLKMSGYKVTGRGSGNSALEYLRDNPVDIVISDIRMPDGDGLMLLEKIRATHPTEPTVILMTGFAEVTRDAVISAGAVDLLAKPYDFATLEKYLQ